MGGGNASPADEANLGLRGRGGKGVGLRVDFLGGGMPGLAFFVGVGDLGRCPRLVYLGPLAQGAV